MSIFNFGKNKKADIVEKWTSTRAPISRDNPVDFDSLLVPDLKNDHARLLDVIDKAIILAENSAYDEIDMLLSKFYSDIKMHLMRENSKLFLYLSVYAKKENRKDLVELMDEAKETGHMLVEFCEEFMVENKFDSRKYPEIKDKLRTIREVFLSRASKEETRLFPMYREK